MAKLPILYDLNNNRIILERIRLSDEQKDSTVDYVDILGYCAFDETDEEEMLWNRFKDADDEVKAEVTRLLLQGMPDHGINDLPFK